MSTVTRANTRRRGPARALTAIVVAAVIAGGCGGGDGGGDASTATTPSAPTHASYERQLRATMRALARDWPTDPAAVRSDPARTRTALEDAAGRLDRIDAPADLAATHEHLVHGIRGIGAAVATLEQAQESATSDPRAAAELGRTFAADPAFREVSAATRELAAAGIDVSL